MFKKIEEIFISPEDGLKKILSTIQKSGIGIALVINEDKKLLGTITDGDVRRALINTDDVLKIRAMDLMNKNPLKGHKNMTKREMLLLLKKEKRYQLPIVDENNRIITIYWINRLLEELGEIAIPLSEPDISQLEIKYVNETIKSTWISTSGANVDVFKEKLAEYLGFKNIVMTNTGTAALHTLLLSFSIGKGDEVILPSLTFIATANAISYVGATPVFVDVDKETWNIDPEQVEKKITSKTKAIIVVHLLGNPANMDKLNHIAKKHKILLFEDAAQAFGARYNNKLCGTLGDGAILSFNGNKLVTTGGGGAVIIKDKERIKLANAIVNQGRFSEEKYRHDIIGYNYKMTNLHAAVGLAQLERRDELLSRRRENHFLYREYLKKINGLKFQKTSNGSSPNYWITGVFVDQREFGISAKELLKIMRENGVFCERMYPPIPTQTPYKSFYNEKDQNKSKYVSENIIFLPSSSNLQPDDVKYISKVIEDVHRFYKES